VTTRVLTDVPGMQRVSVVEIEPAVLAMSRHFFNVNGDVLTRPSVSVVVDDARSALQIDRRRYDVIVSEPSNPWLAGVATLYTPEFFRIVQGRLAGDGVFCQWIQLYQLPLAVVAGIVGNVRAVFPHVELWFSSPSDVMVLASARPLAQEPAWLERLVGPRGALGEPASEYLAIDRPEDFPGHRLLGEAGVAALLAHPTAEHEDDRPRLEFLAARRFLDGRGTEGVFDSLVAIRAATRGHDSTSPFLFAKALTVRRGDVAGERYIEAARRARPADPLWTVHAAAIHLALGDTVFADTALGRLVRAGRDPDAWLLAGLLALQHGQGGRAASLLSGALAAGADAAEARAGLAALAARGHDWKRVAVEARAAFAAARGTLRHPYPRDLLGQALTALALEGPAEAADSVTREALSSRSGWSKFHELRAVAALRAGRCDDAAQQFLALLEFGITRDDGPAMVMRCRRGEKL